MLLLLLTTLLALSQQSQLKVLNTPDGPGGPAPCALTCSGFARWSDQTKWTKSDGFPGKSFKIVKMTGCDFVGAPVVTASVVGGGVCPSVSAASVTPYRFYVYTVQDTDPSVMEHEMCSVHWSAFGYNC